MTPSIYTQLTYFSWLALFIVWFFGRFGNKRSAHIPNWGEQVFIFVLLVCGFWALFNYDRLPGLLREYLYIPSWLIGWLGMVLAYSGVLFAIWARITLGSNWSGTVVMIKKDHELVQGGPYAMVRHPIYSGFLAGALGTAVTIGTLGTFIAIAPLLIAFIIRIRREELMLTSQFPNEYPAYRKRTRALIPFVW